jgi:hypothetical protein
MELIGGILSLRATAVGIAMGDSILLQKNPMEEQENVGWVYRRCVRDFGRVTIRSQVRDMIMCCSKSSYVLQIFLHSETTSQL